METAGLILDLYDEPRDISAIYPTLEDVPSQVKEAQVLTQGQRESLPDHVFALVLDNGGDPLRKYACLDAGGTLLNVGYFLRHGHKLPEEAQKVAARNLQVACGWYDIEPPEELCKVALGLNTLMTAAVAPSLIKGTHSQISNNLAGVEAAGRQVVPLHQQQALGQMMKGAEATGTSLMTSQEPGDMEGAVARGKPGSSNTSAAKSAAVGHLVDGHGSEKGDELERAFGVAGTQYEKAPQTPEQRMAPKVDVRGKEPPKKLETKEAALYQTDGMFPLDSYTQVKEAARYLEANKDVLPSEFLHTFAVPLVKRAAQLGIEMSKEAQAYGATTLAPDEQLRAALDMRRPYMEKEASALDELFASRGVLGPDVYCLLLTHIDKTAGVDWMYGRNILNPQLSTYGVKEASQTAETWVHSNDYVTKGQIENFAVTAALAMRDDYGDGFVKEFQKDPWGIFNSLPLPQQIRIARRASDNSATGMRDVQR